MLRRDSLRAQRDFFSPMTGNTGTEIRYAAAPTPVSGKYGSEVKGRLADIGSGSGRRAELIKAKKAAMNKTDDPFSKIQEIKEKGSQDNNDIAGQIGGAVSAAQSAVRGAADAFDREYGALSDQYQKDRQTTSDQIKGVSESFDKQYGVLQSDIKSVKNQVSTVGTQVSTVGSQLDKVKADLNKPKPPQVTTKPENTPAKAVEVATKAKEEAAAEPKKKTRKAFMGNSRYKMKKRVANRNKAKAMAKKRKAKKTSSPSRSGTTGGRGFGGRGGRRGGSTGGRGASSKGGVSRGSRSKSTGRGGARGGARGGSAGRGASSKGGTRRGARKSNRGRRGRRGGRRCDIRCKINISLLTNMNLLRDDLADVAYFVRELREAEL